MNSPLTQNQWLLKTTKNEGTCFICSKFTTGCLVYKFGQIDWFYTCLSHLEDSGFAKLLPSLTTPQTSKVSTTESNTEKKVDDKAKTEASEKDKDKDKDENSNDKSAEAEKKEESKPEPPANLPKIYQLHRSILYLRENQLKLKKQQNQVKSTKMKLPSAPNHDLK